MLVQLYFLTFIGMSALFIEFSKSEIYSSMSDIKDLLGKVKAMTAQDLVTLEMLDTNTKKGDKDIAKLLKDLMQLSDGINDRTFTPHHPVDAYRFLRNFSVIYSHNTRKFFQRIRNISEAEDARHRGLTDELKPQKEDLDGMLKGILRLQYTYDLKAHNIADGNFSGYLSKQKLTGSDCSRLMVMSYTYYQHTTIPKQWLDVSLQRVTKAVNSITPVAIYTSAIEVLTQYDYSKEATRLYAKLVEKATNKRYHRLKQKEFVENLSFGGQKWTIEPKRPAFLKHDTLCQGQRMDIELGKLNRNLVCKLIFNPHPLLMYETVKLEQRSRQPHIVVYHDVLSKKEMSTIKEIAKLKLKRATVRHSDGTNGPFPLRTCKSAFVNMTRDPFTLTKKVEALTGLIRSDRFNDDMQIANYGVGGQYFVHTDYYDHRDDLTDNRLATFMIYLSTVEMGGATIFLDAGETIYPEEGKAVFWYNMYRNGTANRNTRHAACPVQVGDKWVATYWIHTQGQEFSKPCSLDQFEPEWSNS